MKLANAIKSCESNEFSDGKNFKKSARPLQEIDAHRVRPEAESKGVGFVDSSTLRSSSKSNSSNEMPRFLRPDMNSIPRNSPVVNQLGGPEHPENHEKSDRKATLMRWCKFNFVGWMGMIVQFLALFFLKSVTHFNYLAATAIAVEAAVVHNFVWHEQFTWADRVQPSWRMSLRQFMRFNLTTGAVSIIGNLALIKVMVGFGHTNYLLANAIAIVLCSLANFLVSESWVFEE